MTCSEVTTKRQIRDSLEGKFLTQNITFWLCGGFSLVTKPLKQPKSHLLGKKIFGKKIPRNWRFVVLRHYVKFQWFANLEEIRLNIRELLGKILECNITRAALNMNWWFIWHILRWSDGKFIAPHHSKKCSIGFVNRICRGVLAWCGVIYLPATIEFFRWKEGYFILLL